MKKKQLLKYIGYTALLVVFLQVTGQKWLEKHDWNIEKHNPEYIYHIVGLVDDGNTIVLMNRNEEVFVTESEQVQKPTTEEFYYKPFEVTTEPLEKIDEK